MPSPSRLALPLLLLAAACGKGTGTTDPAPGVPLVAASGDTLGAIQLEQRTGVMVLHLTAHDLPAGTHGMHLHANGACVPPDFKTAGGHFNPLGKHHGRLNPDGAHAGDLPNLVVARDGRASVDLPLTTIQRAELLNTAGAALVIHADPDDEKTDPSGNSGDRIACAVVKR